MSLKGNQYPHTVARNPEGLAYTHSPVSPRTGKADGSGKAPERQPDPGCGSTNLSDEYGQQESVVSHRDDPTVTLRQGDRQRSLARTITASLQKIRCNYWEKQNDSPGTPLRTYRPMDNFS